MYCGPGIRFKLWALRLLFGRDTSVWGLQVTTTTVGGRLPTAEGGTFEARPDFLTSLRGPLGEILCARLQTMPFIFGLREGIRALVRFGVVALDLRCCRPGLGMGLRRAR